MSEERAPRCRTGWRFWRDPHEWGVGKCEVCGTMRACGASSGGTFVAYHCTRPINHPRDGHRQGPKGGSNVTWGGPVTDDEWDKI